jgi:hypothetical protein
MLPNRNASIPKREAFRSAAVVAVEIFNRLAILADHAALFTIRALDADNADLNSSGWAAWHGSGRAGEVGGRDGHELLQVMLLGFRFGLNSQRPL